jgi:hypothetical protein
MRTATEADFPIGPPPSEPLDGNGRHTPIAQSPPSNVLTSTSARRVAGPSF